MAIRIYHPKHGYHNVFSQIEYEEHEKRGWSKIIEKTPEPVKPVEIIVEQIKVIEVLPVKDSIENFQCDVCNKSFKKKMFLMNHKRSHKR